MLTPSASARSSRRFERGFYLWTSFLFAAMVFWTFARTYYFRPLSSASGLPVLLQIHGAVMTGWVVLLLVQSSLITAHRIQWHRRLGVAGVVWAGLVVLLGSTATVHAAMRQVRGHTPLANGQVVIMGLELVQMLLFAGLVTASTWWRRRVDLHKRLMLLTIVCMLPSVLARLPVSFMSNRLILSGLDLSVVACVAIDTLRHRRLHPAFGWGGLVVLGGLHVAFHLTTTPTWIGFGRWVVS